MNILKPFGKGISDALLRLTLCDQNSEMVQAWAVHFAEVAAVEIVEGDLLDVDCCALLSPANSFGDMGGGVDKKIDDFYQGAAQSAAMAAIRDRFYGELPVGMALVLELPNRHFPFLVVAPTMRIPSRVGDSINAYLAMRGALVAVLEHNKTATRKINHLAIPGLCTGVGGMEFNTCAEQMRTAYDIICGEGWKRVVSPALAPYAWKPKRAKQ